MLSLIFNKHKQFFSHKLSGLVSDHSLKKHHVGEETSSASGFR